MDQGFINKQMSDEQSDYTGKLSGLFIAPNSGNFGFAVCSNDAAELYLSTSADPSGKVMVASSSSACDKPSSYDSPVELVEGEFNLHYVHGGHYSDVVKAQTIIF